MLGIISGTMLLTEMQVSKKLQKIKALNEFGEANLFLSDDFVFIQRHFHDQERYILPHLINHRANIKALLDIGVSEIVGINSTGSLKKDISPGLIVIPDDFIMLLPYPSVYSDRPIHITPGLDIAVRRHCLEAAFDAGTDVINGGKYWQTVGPRLETMAEIKMISLFADIVGMTMASEAIIAGELGLPYASICSVDNYAHGLVKEVLTMDEISSNAARTSETIVKIVSRYLDRKNF
jgi:5'-methylthioadenosine phosphorylase